MAVSFVAKPVEWKQRWNKRNRCPNCGGCQTDPQGQGMRCFGFLSQDDEWIHCTREELAGSIKQNPNTLTFPHKRFGRCDCGKEHNYTGEKITEVPERIWKRGSGKPKNLNYQFVERYTYRDLDGKVIAYKDRLEAYDKDGVRLGKKFSWRDAEKKYSQGLVMELEIPPYRMWQAIKTLESVPIWLVEGERCVHVLEKHGKTAICSPFAATYRWEVDPLYFERRYVYIIPDNDEPGKRHAESIAERLAPFAAEIRILNLGLDTEGADIIQWFESGKTVEELDALAETTVPWQEQVFSALQSLTNSIRKYKERNNHE